MDVLLHLSGDVMMWGMRFVLSVPCSWGGRKHGEG